MRNEIDKRGAQTVRTQTLNRIPLIEAVVALIVWGLVYLFFRSITTIKLYSVMIKRFLSCYFEVLKCPNNKETIPLLQNFRELMIYLNYR